MNNPIGVVSCHLEFSSFDEAFEKAREYGMEDIEWFDYDASITLDPAVAEQIARLSKKYGIKNSYHAPYQAAGKNQWDMGQLSLADACKTLRNMLGCARRLEAELMTVHLGSFDPSLDRRIAMEKVAAAIGDCAKLAEDFQVCICVENVPLCRSPYELGSRTEDFDVIFEAVASGYVGMTLDSGHARIMGNMDELLSRHGSRLRDTHLHDTDGSTDGHLAPGEGSSGNCRRSGIKAR
ncbi:MAG: sugar phosphate isomerase/epimerase [Phycisphaerae bacterium]|nr:sugar phosphate isomerase/epimerase [Phycisphaerae bacterium]